MPVVYLKILVKRNQVGFTSSKVEELCLEYSEKNIQIITAEFEIYRKSKAQEFYAFSIGVLDDEIVGNERLRQLLNSCDTELQAQLQVLISNKDAYQDNQISLHDEAEYLLDISDEEFSVVQALASLNLKDLKGNRTTNQINDTFTEYVNKQTVISNIDKLSMKDILDRMDDNKVYGNGGIISRLDKLSSVCIKTKGGYGLGTTFPAPQSLGAILVPDPKKTIFSQNSQAVRELASRDGLIFGKTLELGHSSNPDKIIFLKIKGMFPAMAISGIDTLSNKFYHANSYHFCDKYFDGKILDLCKGNTDEEDMTSFILASALGMSTDYNGPHIVLSKGALRFVDSRGQAHQIVRGSKGKTDRSLGFKEFSKNESWKNEIKISWEAFADKSSKSEIGEVLRFFYENHHKPEYLGKELKSMDKESEEYNQIFTERDTCKTFCT